MFAFLTDSDSLWLTLALSGSISRSLCHCDSCSLWLTLPHSGSLSSSPRRSLTHKVLARLSTSEMHSPSSSRPVPPLTLLIPLILFNYTALAAYTAYSMIPLILLRLLGHRRCWTKQKQGSIIGTECPSPLTHIQMTKFCFKVFPYRLLRRKRSMQAMIYNSKEADLLLLMSSHMGQMGPL